MAYLNLVCCQLIRPFDALDVFQLAIFVCAKRKPVFTSLYDFFIYRICFLRCSGLRLQPFQYVMQRSKRFIYC